MTEIQLQSGIARKFSELYPNKRGQLFHVANERNNKIQVFKALAIGIVPGVADFIFFSNDFNVAIELKSLNSRHTKDKIRTQLKWAKTWEKQGNTWRLCRTIEEAISCTEGNFQGMTRKEAKELMNSTSTKTMKF